MRQKGAGAVAVIVLAVVIAACVGFVVYWMSKSGPPAAPKDVSKTQIQLKCIAEGCDWTKTTTLGEAMQMPYGPAFDGDGELYKCPTCGKVSVGQVAKCAQCGSDHVNRGKGCPKCAGKK